MIYFTSDQHFFYQKSPCVGAKRFQNKADKNEYLIKRWNETVEPEDQVYILGDLSEGNGADTAGILRRLNGKKYLVIGNNDHYLEDPDFDQSVFVWCRQYYELHYQGEKYVLFHFPIEVWSGCGKNRIHVHGHLHSRNAVPLPVRRYEVGVDAHDGKPVSIEQIWNVVKDFSNEHQGEALLSRRG